MKHVLLILFLFFIAACGDNQSVRVGQLPEAPLPGTRTTTQLSASQISLSCESPATCANGVGLLVVAQSPRIFSTCSAVQISETRIITHSPCLPSAVRLNPKLPLIAAFVQRTPRGTVERINIQRVAFTDKPEHPMAASVAILELARPLSTKPVSLDFEHPPIAGENVTAIYFEQTGANAFQLRSAKCEVADTSFATVVPYNKDGRLMGARKCNREVPLDSGGAIVNSANALIGIMQFTANNKGMKAKIQEMTSLKSQEQPFEYQIGFAPLYCSSVNGQASSSCFDWWDVMTSFREQDTLQLMETQSLIANARKLAETTSEMPDLDPRMSWDVMFLRPRDGGRTVGAVRYVTIPKCFKAADLPPKSSVKIYVIPQNWSLDKDMKMPVPKLENAAVIETEMEIKPSSRGAPQWVINDSQISYLPLTGLVKTCAPTN
jgi:hypothetical protein